MMTMPKVLVHPGIEAEDVAALLRAFGYECEISAECKPISWQEKPGKVTMSLVFEREVITLSTLADQVLQMINLHIEVEEGIAAELALVSDEHELAEVGA